MLNSKKVKTFIFRSGKKTRITVFNIVLDVLANIQKGKDKKGGERKKCWRGRNKAW